MAGKVVGLGFEITSKLDSYFLMTVQLHQNSVNLFVKDLQLINYSYWILLNSSSLVPVHTKICLHADLLKSWAHRPGSVLQYSDNGGDKKGGHSKPKAPKHAPAKPKPKPTPPQTTAAPEPLAPPTYVDDNYSDYGSSNYDEYEQEADLFNDYEADYSDDAQTQQQQGKANFITGRFFQKQWFLKSIFTFLPN